MIRDERRRAALLAMLTVWKNFGDQSVLIDPRGRHWRPLKDAEALGWARWFGDRCRLEPAGIEQLIPYGVAVAVDAEAGP